MHHKPKIAPCGHTCCSVCTPRLSFCPICKEPFPSSSTDLLGDRRIFRYSRRLGSRPLTSEIPESGTSFRDNFALKELLAKTKKIYSKCGLTKEYEEFVCVDCKKIVCLKCIDEEHQDHSFKRLSQAVSLVRQGMKESQDEIKEIGGLVPPFERRVEEIGGKNKEEANRVLYKVDFVFSEMINRLGEARKYMLKELSEEYERVEENIKNVLQTTKERKVTLQSSEENLKKIEDNLREELYKEDKDQIYAIEELRMDLKELIRSQKAEISGYEEKFRVPNQLMELKLLRDDIFSKTTVENNLHQNPFKTSKNTPDCMEDGDKASNASDSYSFGGNFVLSDFMHRNNQLSTHNNFEDVPDLLRRIFSGSPAMEEFISENRRRSSLINGISTRMRPSGILNPFAPNTISPEIDTDEGLLGQMNSMSSSNRSFENRQREIDRLSTTVVESNRSFDTRNRSRNLSLLDDEISRSENTNSRRHELDVSIESEAQSAESEEIQDRMPSVSRLLRLTGYNLPPLSNSYNPEPMDMNTPEEPRLASTLEALRERERDIESLFSSLRSHQEDGTRVDNSQTRTNFPSDSNQDSLFGLIREQENSEASGSQENGDHSPTDRTSNGGTSDRLG